jgi:effector-binding domain-containing protein
MNIRLLNRPITMAILSASLFTTACNDNKNGKQDTKQTDTAVKKSDTDKNISLNSQSVVKPPIINITDSLSTKKIVLVIKDSASTQERISIKLAEIFGTRLQEVIKKNNLKIVGPPMAWYQSQKAPYFFEAGFPIDKKPAKLFPPIKIKEIGVDSIVLVHFYGPYNLTYMAYDAVSERMKSNKKSLAGAPYEIYVSDPIDKDGKPVDPYRVQTDIVFPRN